MSEQRTRDHSKTCSYIIPNGIITPSLDIESNYTAIVGRMSRESVEQGWTAGASLHTRMYTRVHAQRTIMRFRAAAAAVDRRPIASRRCVCVCADTGSFFLRIALLLHGTSGHVPPVTHPRPSRFTLSPSHPL